MMIDLLKTRRSIRKFQAKDVEKEKIELVLKGALLSPSSRSIRPWEFISITDKSTLKKLSLCRENASKFLGEAPLGIVIIADPEACDVWIEDSSIAAIVTQLTAQSLGLGSCWIQIRERYHSESEKAEEYIKGILNIPEKYKVECIIAIGYAGEDKKATTDEDLKYNKIHSELF